ncbi:hypothetical protein A2363_00295 [Candidatus Gottesmanbacteria bacterium RIFOXYB1_FULL_47_11]|uniref:Uncharacterized protein n=1 Tax=Candidatus Gottesmanbacteria bacterium RIFOXYB1_FULL_47_11 TaxID=1798401 RepID=A0A1F6BD64_9BACT|nr:MAG: hypothetical protein A2363_00295 [Candidatus Gottesmanbacteria bacterium RIFOXYB1_FULL_47_11]
MNLAQIRNPVLPPSLGGGNNPNPDAGGEALGQLISNLVSGLFIAAFLLAFVTIIIGGVSWITAGGDKQKLEKARDQITNALIGLIVVAAAWAIATLAGQFLGLDLTNLSIPGFRN